MLIVLVRPKLNPQLKQYLSKITVLFVFTRCRYLSSERETMLSVQDELAAMPEGTEYYLVYLWDCTLV